MDQPDRAPRLNPVRRPWRLNRLCQPMDTAAGVKLCVDAARRAARRSDRSVRGIIMPSDSRPFEEGNLVEVLGPPARKIHKRSALNASQRDTARRGRVRLSSSALPEPTAGLQYAKTRHPERTYSVDRGRARCRDYGHPSQTLAIWLTTARTQLRTESLGLGLLEGLAALVYPDLPHRPERKRLRRCGYPLQRGQGCHDHQW